MAPQPRQVTTPSPDVAESGDRLEPASEGDWLSGLRGRVFVGALTVTPFLAHLYLRAPCPMKLATGLDCPGCGGIRATGALLSGDFRSAADLNLLVVVAPLVVMVYLTASRRRSSWAVWRVERFWLAMSVLTAWTVLRRLARTERVAGCVMTDLVPFEGSGGSTEIVTASGRTFHWHEASGLEP